MSAIGPRASEIDVRSHVGDEGNSGRDVLNVSFVEFDPKETWSRADRLTPA